MLTEAGYRKLVEASCAHHADIARMFTDQFSEQELGTLAELLGRLAAPVAAPAR
jgi:hypothetical protein